MQETQVLSSMKFTRPAVNHPIPQLWKPRRRGAVLLWLINALPHGSAQAGHGRPGREGPEKGWSSPRSLTAQRQTLKTPPSLREVGFQNFEFLVGDFYGWDEAGDRYGFLGFVVGGEDAGKDEKLVGGEVLWRDVGLL